MTRELAVLITAAIAVVILALMTLAWRRRMRRDSALVAPSTIPEQAQVRSRAAILYVATTRHGQPLERVAIKPLVYRARGEAVITDLGLVLRLDGAPPVFLAGERIVDVDRATWAIDRVVEPDGLVCVAWDADPDTRLDSYLRLASKNPTAFISELRALRPGAQTGATS